MPEVGDEKMKALGLAAALFVLLIGTILVWAIATGSPQSGEPVALLQIDGEKGTVFYRAEGSKQAGQTGENTPGKPADRQSRTGRSEVVLNISPPGKRQPAALPVLPVAGHEDGLVEPSDYGLLPRRAADGRRPATAYARPWSGHVGTQPRIAILVTGLGLNQRLSRLAIRKLPGEVTLAFSAYGRKLGDITAMARRQGHELMLQIPMEPVDYPVNDTGPKTLLASRGLKENRPRLYWALGRFTGYFGVVNKRGGRYLSDRRAVAGFFSELQKRGLFFFRDQAGQGASLEKIAGQTGLGYAQATLQIEAVASKEGMKLNLQKLEIMARRSGIAIGVAGLHPVSVDLIGKWAATLKEKGLHLIPVSAAYGRSS